MLAKMQLRFTDEARSATSWLREKTAWTDAAARSKWMELADEIRGFPRHLSQHRAAS
jgi:DNA polymerase III alpha subunit